MASFWVCPVCRRRVPNRVLECWCGVTRAQAERHAARSAEEEAPAPFPWGMAAVTVAVALAIVWQVARGRGEPERPAPAAAPLPSTPSASRLPAKPPTPLPPSPQRFDPARSGSLLTPAPSATWPPAVPAAQALAARREPTPTPPSAEPGSLEAMRHEGLVKLEASLTALARAANGLATTLRQYQMECEGRRAWADVRGCAPAEEGMLKTLAEIDAGIEAAEDAARRSFVQPGDVRAARQKHKLADEWDALAASVGAVKERRRPD